MAVIQFKTSYESHWMQRSAQSVSTQHVVQVLSQDGACIFVKMDLASIHLLRLRKSRSKRKGGFIPSSPFFPP